MNDALLMRVLNGLANLREELQAILGGEMVLVAILGDAHAAHEFHDEVGTPRLRRARVEHARDVRMLHHRQRLPLGLEAGDDRLRVHAELDDLERDAAAHRLLLLGHVHDAAAALADLLQQLVASDAVARLLGDIRRKQSGFAEPHRAGGRGGGSFEEVTDVGLFEQQFLHAAAHVLVAAARRAQKRTALGGFTLQRIEKQLAFARAGGS